MSPLEIAFGALGLLLVFCVGYCVGRDVRRYQRSLAEWADLRQQLRVSEQEYAEIAYLEELWRRKACR